MKIINLALAALALTTALAAHAQSDKVAEHTFEVTITNLTKGQTFTPQLLTTHKRGIHLFEAGAPASLSLELLAEAGDTAPLSADLSSYGAKVADIQTVPGLLPPGASVTATITASPRHRFLSMAAMLIPTNDTFVAADSIRLPWRGTVAYTGIAYDAGTEANDQNCLNMPGPRCPGGEAHSPGPNVGDEGFVYVSNGFHALPAEKGADVLGPAQYDWRNPVARIAVKRIR